MGGSLAPSAFGRRAGSITKSITGTIVAFPQLEELETGSDPWRDPVPPLPSRSEQLSYQLACAVCGGGGGGGGVIVMRARLYRSVGLGNRTERDWPFSFGRLSLHTFKASRDRAGGGYTGAERRGYQNSRSRRARRRPFRSSDHIKATNASARKGAG